MSYKPLSKLDSSRLPNVVEGLGREDVVVVDRHEVGKKHLI